MICVIIPEGCVLARRKRDSIYTNYREWVRPHLACMRSEYCNYSVRTVDLTGRLCVNKSPQIAFARQSPNDLINPIPKHTSYHWPTPFSWVLFRQDVVSSSHICVTRREIAETGEPVVPLKDFHTICIGPRPNYCLPGIKHSVDLSKWDVPNLGVGKVIVGFPFWFCIVSDRHSMGNMGVALV